MLLGKNLLRQLKKLSFSLREKVRKRG